MTSFAFGQESINIDTDYVNSSKAASYKEWTGGYAPHEINTAEQIKDIGRRLGRGIKYQESVQNDPNPYNKGNPAYKYSSARIYGNDKRGADVILIGKTATVDTIKCLKMILRGYLEAAFGYSDMDARAVAENICYWNSNNYNNTEMFGTKFENALMTVFDGYYKNAGLSESYTDWKESILIIPHAFVETATAIEETETVLPILSARKRMILRNRTGSVICFCPLRFSRSRISRTTTAEYTPSNAAATLSCSKPTSASIGIPPNLA